MGEVAGIKPTTPAGGDQQLVKPAAAAVVTPKAASLGPDRLDLQTARPAETPPRHSISLVTGITGTTFTITNPAADSATNTKTMLALDNLLGTSLELLTDKFPGLDKNVLYRIAEAGTYLVASHTLQLISHEGGHYHVAKSDGLDPSITITGWSGYTSWTYHGDLADPNNPRRRQMDADLSAAGMNQSTLNSQAVYEHMQLGDPRYYDAVDYLLNKLDNSLYLATSMIHQARGTVREGDDNVDYANVQTARGRPITTGEMLLPALLSDLLSASTWNSLYAGIRYLATGDKHFTPWTIKAGSVEITPPDFSYFRSAAGEAVEGSLLVNPHGSVPVKVSVASDLDFRGNGNDLNTRRAGIKLYHLTPPLPVLDHVSFNPYAYVDVDHGFKPTGFMAGSEAEVKLQRNISLIGDVGYARNDLIQSKIRFSDGVYTYAGVKVSF